MESKKDCECTDECLGYLTKDCKGLYYDRTYQPISLSKVEKKETLSLGKLVEEAGSEEELIKILKLPHIAPLVREAMRNNCKK